MILFPLLKIGVLFLGLDNFLSPTKDRCIAFKLFDFIVE